MRRKLKQQPVALPPAYKIVDKRGTDTLSKRYRAGSLYPNPLNNTPAIRPRFYSVTDTPRAFSAYDRVNLIKYSRELFASSPNLNGAVRQKASYSCLDSFAPRYRGSNFAWGQQVEDWLRNRFFQVANVRGGNYSLLNTLYAISVALDVDGDCLVYLTQSRDGFPQFGVIPAHRIGQRYSQEKEVKDGRYRGNLIFDGVIVNSNMRPIAYRILGDSPSEDYDISAQSALLFFESQWTDSVRGVSNFGSVLIDALNGADIDYYLQQGVKLDSAIGLLAYTENGQADPANIVNPVLAEDETPVCATSTADKPEYSTPAIEPLLGGLINYFKAGTNERLEAFKTDRPHANVENFVNRLERRCMYGIGWPYEMLNCSQLGGAAVRLVQSEARNAIRSRQNTLARVARFIVSYAVAKAMENDLIPANYDDQWYNWQFNFGPLLTVDNGNEADADRKDLLLGSTTLEKIAAKSGEDWYDLRNQTTKEVNDLLERAKGTAKTYGISIDKALDLLSQRSANPSSTAAPLPDNTDSTNTK